MSNLQAASTPDPDSELLAIIAHIEDRSPDRWPGLTAFAAESLAGERNHHIIDGIRDAMAGQDDGA